MDTNRAALDRRLAAGAKVTYVDHHFPGEIPQHGNLTAHINTDASCCTSLLVNEMLEGRFLPWAITAAFGDNLNEAARKAAEPLVLIARPWKPWPILAYVLTTTATAPR